MARDKKPITAYQLWLYIRSFFKFTMPHKPCCSNHLTPFHMVWYLYKRIYPEFAALGSRNSFKTLGLATSETLDLLFGDGNVVHIGAIDKQAQRCYSYVRKFLFPEYEDLVYESLMIRTTMHTGNTLEIIPCTMNQVNGPHESRVNFDEVELANPLAYQDAKGIPVSNYKTGEPPSICYTSTRKFPHGLFGQTLERLQQQGKPVVSFCYKDVTARCPDSRSGKKKVRVFINSDKYEWSIKQETKDYHPYIVRTGCLQCDLLTTCRGDLKKANGVMPIEDAIVRFNSSTSDFWTAQGECRKPKRKGMMVYNFSAANVEVVDWKQFLDKHGIFNRERYLYVGGKDFNYSPDATLLIIIDRDTNDVYVVKEFEFNQKTIPNITMSIVDWCQSTPFGLPEDIQADKSEPGLIATMQATGLPMTFAADESDVEGGVDLLNYLCKPPNRKPMLHIDVSCKNLIFECEKGYRRKTDPKTGEPTDIPLAKNNHWVDCLRYAMWKWLKHLSTAYDGYSDLHTKHNFDVITDLKEELGNSSYDEQDILSSLLKNDMLEN